MYGKICWKLSRDHQHLVPQIKQSWTNIDEFSFDKYIFTTDIKKYEILMQHAKKNFICTLSTTDSIEYFLICVEFNR